MKDQDRIKLEAELSEAQAKNARLAAALEESLCGRCGGQGWYPWFDGNGVETHQQPCEKCRGTGHPQPDPTALRGLLGPVVELLTMLEQREHSRDGASHLWKLIDIQLTRLRALVERKA